MGDRTRLILALLLGLIALSVAGGAMVTSKEVPASEVLAKIELGQPIEFDNYTIVGDLNLSTPTIDGEVHFNDTHFKGLVIFESTTFNSNVYFINSVFTDNADFWKSRFASNADFSNSQFYRYADFSNTSFSNNVYFLNSLFTGNAYFWNSRFGGDANFRISEFTGNADFWSSRFYGNADFVGSTFNKDADFRKSKFTSNATFEDSKFDSYADFSNAWFDYYASFRDTRFRGDAFIEDTTFNKEADFNGCRFINAFFQGTRFNKSISLEKTKYEKLHITWINIANNLEFDNDAYVELINNFKTLGFSSDASDAYYQYNDKLRRRMSPVQDFGNFIRLNLFWFFVGYGVKPEQPILLSILVIFLFSIIWTMIGRSKPAGIIDEYNSTEDWFHNMRSIKEASRFSIIVFLSGYGLSYITQFFVGSPNIPELSGWLGTLIKCIFIIERVLGVILSILISYNLSKLVTGV